MQYSPKLKKAAAEIIEILKKYDIAAMVALHTPGFGEHIMHLQTSYSAAKITDIGIRIRALTSEFNGDVEKRDQVINNTANMLHTLAELTARLFTAADDLSQAVDKATNALHTRGGHSSHNEQNN